MALCFAHIAGDRCGLVASGTEWLYYRKSQNLTHSAGEGGSWWLVHLINTILSAAKELLLMRIVYNAMKSMASMLESSESWKSAGMIQAILKARAHMSLGSADEPSPTPGKNACCSLRLGECQR